jgi:glycosyltransferase involved in cell wall biosynthesis
LGFLPAIKLGGPVQNAYHLTRNLVQRGNQVTVVCTNLASRNEKLFSNTRRSTCDGVDVIYFNTAKLFPLGLHSFGLFVSPGMIKFFRENIRDFDAVHIDGYRDFPSIVASYFCRKFGVPYVIQPRGSMARTSSSLVAKQIFDFLIGRQILSAARLFIASSRQEAASFRKIVPGGKETLEINDGLEVCDFANLPKKGAFRREHGVSKRYLLTYVGRIHSQKRIDILIRAFLALRHREETQLFIIGPDDGDKKKLASLVGKLGLGNSVLFCDALQGPAKLAAYVDSDAVVYVTPSESFGMVPIEATMCGTPAICADDSPCGDLLASLGAGFLSPYGDPEKLAAVIDGVLDDRIHAAQKAQAAADQLQSVLCWDTIARKYESAYRTAISPHATAAIAAEIS